MASQHGMTSPQNYDLISKWLAEALRGQTLEVLGIRTGRIEEVRILGNLFLKSP